MFRSEKDIASYATYTLALALAVVALVLMSASLHWHYVRDTPLLNYAGFLIWEHGFAPYRDVFETSMPGTLVFHSLVAGLGLSDSLGFMVLAHVIILGFALCGALLVLPLGRPGALLAFPLIVVAMLLLGPAWILKIDMVALLPISAALCCAIWRWPGPVWLRQAMIGLLFGIAATLKPHLVIGAPVAVLAAYVIEDGSGRLRSLSLAPLLRQTASALAGAAVPLGLVWIWLVSVGAQHDFLFVLTDYLPLHLEKTDWQVFLPPGEKRQIVLASTIRFGGHFHLAPMVLLTAGMTLAFLRLLSVRQGTVLVVLCLLTVLYGLSPAAGGQFYIYYYIPYFFFGLLTLAASAGLVLHLPARQAVKMLWVAGLGVFLLLFGNRFYHDGLLRANSLDQVVRMEQALRTWLPEGGRVQPIDWTSGVIHAMLRQKVLPATPYLYDYHFHHHVGSDINIRLRARFMVALRAASPELMMKARDFPRVSGLNTSVRFAQRDAFLAQHYRLVEEDPDFRVYLRRDLVGLSPVSAGGS